MRGRLRRMAAVWARSERAALPGRAMYSCGEERSMSKLPGYRRALAGTQPEYLHATYKSSLKRAPSQPLVYLPHTLSEITGPVFAPETVNVKACDLTRQHSGEPLGERIIVSGRVMDEDGKPVRKTLLEVWQANARGGNRNKGSRPRVPRTPNFGAQATG